MKRCPIAAKIAGSIEIPPPPPPPTQQKNHCTDFEADLLVQYDQKPEARCGKEDLIITKININLCMYM